ncbi:MAG TPA: SDR family NAD(P)-dependent oxidoreductase [Chitinophagaceae bacterium]|nr:SDR family NAD(P)-dependent oxidoreductase [Chitinophagaceae bacterium]
MNRIVFITGATSGIGKACAEKFAQSGDHLILNGRRKERLEELKKSLQEKYKVNILAVPFDVRNREEVFNAVHSFPEKWKQIDLLINSAGLAVGRDYFEEAPLEDWETMLQTNVTGLLYVSRAVIPFMIAKNKGHIINLGSVAGDEVYEKGNVYCATKSAVEAISRSMRIDMLRHGIKVTNVKPGAVETEFSLVRFKGDAAQASKVYDGFTPLTGDDIAGIVHYCASLPQNVCINDIEITPLAQANGIFFYRQPGS